MADISYGQAAEIAEQLYTKFGLPFAQLREVSKALYAAEGERAVLEQKKAVATKQLADAEAGTAAAVATKAEAEAAARDAVAACTSMVDEAKKAHKAEREAMLAKLRKAQADEELKLERAKDEYARYLAEKAVGKAAVEAQYAKQMAELDADLKAQLAARDALQSEVDQLKGRLQQILKG